MVVNTTVCLLGKRVRLQFDDRSGKLHYTINIADDFISKSVQPFNFHLGEFICLHYKSRTRDASLEWCISEYRETSKKKENSFDTYHYHLIIYFVKTSPVRRTSMSMFKNRTLTTDLIDSMSVWGTGSRVKRKLFKVGFGGHNLPLAQKRVGKYPVYWSSVVIVLYWLSILKHWCYQVINNWNRKIFPVNDGERQKLGNIKISGRMCRCPYLWKCIDSCSYHCRHTWFITFWVLWRHTWSTEDHKTLLLWTRYNIKSTSVYLDTRINTNSKATLGWILK